MCKGPGGEGRLHRRVGGCATPQRGQQWREGQWAGPQEGSRAAAQAQGLHPGGKTEVLGLRTFVKHTCSYLYLGFAFSAPISAPFSFLSPFTIFKNYVIPLSLYLQLMLFERKSSS